MGRYAFDTEQEEYWAHITTGTHVVQICMFLLVEACFIPGVLLQSAPPRDRQGLGSGSYELIDLDLSRYDTINTRLNVAQQGAVSLVELMGSAADSLDYFDRLQLQTVISVCRKNTSLSDAGRELFNVSRTQRSVVNEKVFA